MPRVVQVQSLRADAVLAKVYNLSREKSLELFRAGKVYVNGRLCENNSRQLKSGDRECQGVWEVHPDRGAQGDQERKAGGRGCGILVSIYK